MDSSAPKSILTPFQIVRGVLYLLVGACGLGGLCLFLVYSRRIAGANTVRFLYAWMPWAISAVSFAFVLIGCIRLFSLRPVVMRIIAGVLSVITLACLGFGIYANSTDAMLHSTSPDGHTCFLSWDETTGTAVYYRRQRGIFLREKEQLPYTVDAAPKMQWLTNDICTVTYLGADGNTHQYVATYGDRGDGISYYHAAAAIHGNWQVMSQNTVGWKLTCDTAGITVSNATMVDFYPYSDCVECGTTAIVLCRDGLPQWTIALDENCKIGDDCLVQKGGTLTLCEVSLQRTAPMSLSCIDYKEN